MFDLMTIFHGLQRQLFPALTEELGELSALAQQFCEVISLTQLGRFTDSYEGCGEGRPPCARVWLAHAFIARHVYQFPPAALIEALRARPTLRRLCGWESAGNLPSEPTFSRAFAVLAADQLPQRIHENMVKAHAGNKLVGHVSRDAPAIEAPERPAPKPAPPAPPAPAKRGRPPKGEVRPPAPPKRLALQPTRTLADNLADLPARCDVGCNRNSKGHQESWIGYKLHLDTIDGDMPVSAVLTSASVHDSPVAIALAQMTAQRVTSLYDLMDSAYAAPQIHALSRAPGHVPIMDPNPRGGEELPLAPAEAARFKERRASERVNSLWKERYGGRWVRVRGASKGMGHLMFGLVARTASALFARLC
jgi:hypothetical protein